MFVKINSINLHANKGTLKIKIKFIIYILLSACLVYVDM